MKILVRGPSSPHLEAVRDMIGSHPQIYLEQRECYPETLPPVWRKKGYKHVVFSAPQSIKEEILLNEAKVNGADITVNIMVHPFDYISHLVNTNPKARNAIMDVAEGWMTWAGLWRRGTVHFKYEDLQRKNWIDEVFKAIGIDMLDDFEYQDFTTDRELKNSKAADAIRNFKIYRSLYTQKAKPKSKPKPKAEEPLKEETGVGEILFEEPIVAVKEEKKSWWSRIIGWFKGWFKS